MPARHSFTHARQGLRRCEGGVLGGIQRALRGWAVIIALAAGLLAPAHADVWAYVDARGIAHFAAEKLDDRYELFFRGGAAGGALGSGSPGGAGEGAAGAGPHSAPGANPGASLGANPGLSPGVIPGLTLDGSTESGSFPLPPAAGVYGISPYATRLAAYIEGTAGYQLARPLIEEAARNHRIDIALLQALIAAESGFDPQAVSPKGAIGLMQVMPDTARRFGVSGDARMPVERKLADPQINIRTGARYLRFLLNMFPQQLELALAAYNAGEGAVQRAGNRIPNYKETQNYVRTVMQLYALLKPPPAVGVPGPAAGSPVQAAAPVPAPAPVRPTMPGAVLGRANMPPSLGATQPLLSVIPTAAASASASPLSPSIPISQN